MLRMAAEIKLSHTAAMILQAISTGYVYGFSIMEMTGLPSGTVYPAMRRLERDDLIRSQWERQSIADAEQRPPRKYYKLTAAGRATLETSRKRYPLLERLISTEEAKTT
jgi:PadR family transcriptional regulator PadR